MFLSEVITVGTIHGTILGTIPGTTRGGVTAHGGTIVSGDGTGIRAITHGMVGDGQIRARTMLGMICVPEPAGDGEAILRWAAECWPGKPITPSAVRLAAE